METNKKIIEFTSTDEWFHIIPLGDFHIGNIGFDRPKLEKTVNYIEEHDNIYWLGMGDFLDCITYIDKRFDPTTVEKKYLSYLDNVVQIQLVDLLDILHPIMSKCLGMHRGNHEEKIRKTHMFDIMKEIQNEYAVPMLQDSAFSRIIFRNSNIRNKDAFAVTIFSAHGNVSGRKDGGKINRLTDLIGMFDADIYLLAHSHVKLTTTKDILRLNRIGRVVPEKKVMAYTGCFLNGYMEGVSSYIEKGMFPPSTTGVVKLSINPERRDIHISQ